MIQLKKLVSGALVVSTSLVITGLGFVNSAFAAQLKIASATLSNSTVSQSSSYTIQFNVASTANVGSISMQFSTTATNTTKPANLDVTGIAAGGPSVTVGATPETEWIPAGSGVISGDGAGLVHATRATNGPKSYTAGQTFVITLPSITNNNLTSNCDGTSDSTDSCWIQIKTYSDTAWTTVVDQTAINYTVITPVTVSATVDPILNFIVQGVSSASVVGNDARLSATTGTATTSTPTAISFGDIVAGSAGAKLAQQKLLVTTNANGGYVVYNNYQGSQILTGTAQPANNIDPFTETTATWSVPKAWASPTGTANSVNSGELGMRTSDTVTGATSQFNGADLWGPPTLTPNSNAVMSQTTPDNGARPVYVTFKIEVNAYQPADLYTGTTVYTITSTY